MRVVLFDFNGVTTESSQTGGEIVRSIFPSYMDTEVERTLESFRYGKITEKEFWDRFKTDQTEGRKLIIKSFKINSQLRETAGYLKRKNYVLVLFTEFPKAWIDEIVKQNNLRSVFNKVVCLPHEGLSKKQFPAYKWAAGEFGECVIIDDHITPLRHANKVGMETVWKKTAEQETSFEPDHVIRYLSELKEIL